MSNKKIKNEFSPMMQHYMEVKSKNKDAVVFYRLGDFYEMFFEDAVRVSEMLDLTLTGRDCGTGERAPMCGIPYHAADGYIAKLVAMGEKVAICEQLSAPEKGKIVERDVIRIVSAGTLTENELLDEKTNNYACAVSFLKNKCAVAWADITTGEFCVTEIEGNIADGLSDELVRISPAEIICNGAAREFSLTLPVVEHGIVPQFYAYHEWAFHSLQAESRVKEQLGVVSLAPFALEGETLLVSAAGALLEYLKETQKHALKNINNIRRIRCGNYMMLDYNALRNLEIVRSQRDARRYGSLLWLMDKTQTPMGARNVHNWILAPLQEQSEIDYRLDGVQELYESSMLREMITDQLHSMRDIERLAGKISNGNVQPRDCTLLAQSLDCLPNIRMNLSGVTSRVLQDILRDIPDLSQVSKTLKNAISETLPLGMKEGGYIKMGYNAELDELRSMKTDSAAIIAEIENREREKTGIRNLRTGYNRVFGYYIEVTNSFRDLVPYYYERKQTLTGAERYITPELKEIEQKILYSSEAAIKLEERLYNELKIFLLSHLQELQIAAKSVAVLDTLCGFARLSREKGYCRPQMMAKECALNIVDGRHPVVEQVSRENFVANDTLLDSSSRRMMIITGPNMAGKSTYMRQTALIVLMAHVGCFVPAKSAEIPIIDRIFTRVGANDNLIFNQSTFLVEMTEVAEILRNATENSLLILDEVGRGTSTYDGLSIAWAVVEYIANNVRAKTLFATHYHELTELEGKLDGVMNYKITVKELNGTVVFLRKIMRGGANKSFGIEVAGLAGVPQSVTARAKMILKSLERNGKSAADVPNVVAEVREPSAVERYISTINPEEVTPIQALQLLMKLKQIADDGE